MKRFHFNVRVKNVEESVAFYTALFAAQPTVLKPDYAKWMLEDPRVNFAISYHPDNAGIEHLGIQAESPEELQQVYGRLQNAKGAIRQEGTCTCCYAKSEKSWITDPQGVDWEAFYTFGTATYYGNNRPRRLQKCRQQINSPAMKAIERFLRRQQQDLPRHQQELTTMLANLYFFR